MYLLMPDDSTDGPDGEVAEMAAEQRELRKLSAEARGGRLDPELVYQLFADLAGERQAARRAGWLRRLWARRIVFYR
jgi:hypothetical protein